MWRISWTERMRTNKNYKTEKIIISGPYNEVREIITTETYIKGKLKETSVRRRRTSWL